DNGAKRSVRSIARGRRGWPRYHRARLTKSLSVSSAGVSALSARGIFPRIPAEPATSLDQRRSRAKCHDWNARLMQQFGFFKGADQRTVTNVKLLSGKATDPARKGLVPGRSK